MRKAGYIGIAPAQEVPDVRALLFCLPEQPRLLGESALGGETAVDPALTICHDQVHLAYLIFNQAIAVFHHNAVILYLIAQRFEISRGVGGRLRNYPRIGTIAPEIL